MQADNTESVEYIFYDSNMICTPGSGDLSGKRVRWKVGA